VFNLGEQIDKATNFVWAEVGKELQKQDKERMMALAQQHPERFLAIKTNIDLLELCKVLFPPDNEKLNELTKEIQQKILNINKIDTTFREVAIFLRYSRDMLTVGATITGQIDKQVLPLRTNYGDTNE
jgi:hypothetical protein